MNVPHNVVYGRKHHQLTSLKQVKAINPRKRAVVDCICQRDLAFELKAHVLPATFQVTGSTCCATAVVDTA